MRSVWLRSLALACPLSTLLLCGCDPGDRSPEPSSRIDAPLGSATATGTVLLRLEKMDGVLIEGFQLQVRLEDSTGHLLISSTWDDLVRDLKPDPGMDDSYRSVIRTSVPAGSFVFSTVMHPGMEPDQPTCVTRGQVKPGGIATVTVKFWDRGGCSTVSDSGRG